MFFFKVLNIVYRQNSTVNKNINLAVLIEYTTKTV